MLLPGGKVVTGDLVFRVIEQKHETFRRVSAKDLHIDIKISLVEALSGLSTSVDFLDGQKLAINMENVIKPGHIFKIKGKGMPIFGRPDSFGDLIVTFKISFPKEPIRNQKDVDRLLNILPGKLHRKKVPSTAVPVTLEPVKIDKDIEGDEEEFPGSGPDMDGGPPQCHQQ